MNLGLALLVPGAAPFGFKGAGFDAAVAEEVNVTASHGNPAFLAISTSSDTLPFESVAST